MHTTLSQVLDYIPHNDRPVHIKKKINLEIRLLRVFIMKMACRQVKTIMTVVEDPEREFASILNFN